MSTEVIVALITGCFSLLVSSLVAFYSFETRIRALKAEEAAKQTEHVRLKALEAIEEIVYNLCRLSAISESMAKTIDIKMFSSPQDFLAHFHPKLSESAEGVSKAHNRYRIYLTTEINEEISNVTRDFLEIELNQEKLKQEKEKLSRVINKIQILTNEKYLSLSNKVQNAGLPRVC